MLQVYFGSDVIKIRQTALDYAEKIQREGSTVESIDSDSYQPGIFADASEGVSLFGLETIYIIDMPSQSEEMYEDVLSNLENFKTSAHTFIVIEGPLLAEEKKKFSKYSETIEEFKKAGDERFNTFSLTDALAKKDKKTLWLLFHEAKLSGVALEEIIGVLWWQLKTLRLSALTKSATEAGIKDFPYNKAKRELSRFKDGELESLSNRLNSLLHESRLGLCELDVALERFLLRL